MIGRAIDEIPVVDGLSAVEIEGVNAGLFCWGAFSKFANQDQEGAQAFFVEWGFQQLLNFFEGRVFKFLGLFSEDRDSNTEELIAFAIFAFACFEKALGLGRDRKVCQTFEDFPDLC